MYSPRTGGRYNGARPSKKAIASIKAAIRKRLRNGNQAPWADVVRRLNRTVRGWAAYFCYESLAKARHDVQLHLYHAVRRFLRGRHKPAGPGYRQFPVAAVFGELNEAMFELSQLIAALADIDGAVVLTRRFELVGFGAEIVGPLPNVERVARAVDLEGETRALETPDGVGTRHRSVYRLIAAAPEVMAIVVSQDGSVQFVAQLAGDVTFWDHSAGG